MMNFLPCLNLFNNACMQIKNLDFLCQQEVGSAAVVAVAREAAAVNTW